MKRMTMKKQLILWVLNVLNNESDEKHPMTQTKIAEIISDVYPCDRKTVSRNIRDLKEMGYPIVKTGKGFYIERKAFSLDEIAFIKDAVMSAEGKSEDEKTALATRLSDTLGRMYRR